MGSCGRSVTPERGPVPSRASTNVSCPSSSSAERMKRETTAWPLANHLVTMPTLMRELLRASGAPGVRPRSRARPLRLGVGDGVDRLVRGVAELREQIPGDLLELPALLLGHLAAPALH